MAFFLLEEWNILKLLVMEDIMAKIVIYLAVFLFAASSISADLYRYQDSNGKWIFGDKKSFSPKANDLPKDVEKITIIDNRKRHVKPYLKAVKYDHASKTRHWLLHNPLPVTVQHWLAIKGQTGYVKSVLSMPYENIKITSDELNLDSNKSESTALSLKLEHYYLLGEPTKKPEQVLIPVPFGANKRFRISQGFKGKYSHSGRGNLFAVDIAMPVGEFVRAVKPGLVADGIDDFSIGGAANYFLDKANHVTIMHDDGSYAIYAHILYGSMSVAVGDRVQVGQTLARIGSTGYSTGPHLHFVMRYNSGRGAYSIPFRFETGEGGRVPKQGESYSGAR